MGNVSKMSKKGWVVIPKEIRARHNLKPGDKVAFVEYEGRIGVIPIPEDPVAAMYGIFKDLGGPSLTEDLLRERREEFEREERKLERWTKKDKKAS